MTAPSAAPFAPNYAVHAGTMLEEWLAEQGISQADLSRRTGLSAKTVNQIIRGHAPVTQETALKLESVTSIPAKTWNAMEAIYQEDLARIAHRKKLAPHVDFLADVPITSLRKLGVLRAPSRDKVAVLQEVMNFFGVSDPDAWRQVWQTNQTAVAFRKSSAFKAKPGAVAAWLRLGELELLKTEQRHDFDKNLLELSLVEIRSLTREPDPSVFVPQLVDLLAEAGVTLVFMPEVTGARCSGASRWVNGRPLVQLSLRHKTDDHLWFTLFHELGHLLLHGRNESFLDDGNQEKDREDLEKEEQANSFSADLLIPTQFAAELPTLRSLESMREFADRIGVSPGIVVGRLQRDRNDYRIGNALKRKYQFVNEES